MSLDSATRLLQLVKLRKRLAELNHIEHAARRTRLIEQKIELEQSEADDWRLADIVAATKITASRKLAARIDEETVAEGEASRKVLHASLCVEVATRIERSIASSIDRKEEEARIEELSSLEIVRKRSATD